MSGRSDADNGFSWPDSLDVATLVDTDDAGRSYRISGLARDVA
jgi:hypothetical protein